MTTIFFDESGNTGRQLADADQPIFVLGSSDFSDEECRQLLEPLRSKQAAEIHFKRLRKTAKGQDRIIELIQSDLINENRFKSWVVHKHFMLLTKVMDDLLEPFLRFELNHNFYENGQNIALSNMLFFVLPHAIGEDYRDKFLELYYQMCEEKSEASINAFYHHTYTAQARSRQSSFNLDSQFNMLMATRLKIHEILAGLPRHTFNPAIPAFFSLCVYWGRKHSSFDANCDDSEPLERQADFFSILAKIREGDQPDTQIGFGQSKIELPLKLRNLKFSRSHNFDGIQLVDVITSALSYFLTKQIKNDMEDEFYKKLEATGKLERLITGSLWPSADVTPHELGREGDERGHNPADAITDFVSEQRKK